MTESYGGEEPSLAPRLPDDAAPAPLPVRRDPPWGYQDLLVWLLLILPALVLATLLTQLLFAYLPGRPVNKLVLALPAQLIAYVLWFGGLLLLLQTRYDVPFLRSLGWVMPPARALAASLMAGPVVAILIGILGALLRTPPTRNPVQELLAAGVPLAMLGLFAVVIGPAFEELAFRGFLQPLLVRDLGPALGIFAASLPFGLLHGPEYGWQWQYVVCLCLTGAIFGWTRFRTGSTLASTLVHIGYNFTQFGLFLLTQRKL